MDPWKDGGEGKGDNILGLCLTGGMIMLTSQHSDYFSIQAHAFLFSSLRCFIQFFESFWVHYYLLQTTKGTQLFVCPSPIAVLHIQSKGFHLSTKSWLEHECYWCCGLPCACCHNDVCLGRTGGNQARFGCRVRTQHEGLAEGLWKPVALFVPLEAKGYSKQEGCSPMKCGHGHLNPYNF